jgi:tetratricopeptide (TPR) repeat protein
MIKYLLALALVAAPLPAFATPLDDARARALASPQSAEAQFELVVALARSPEYDQAWDALSRLQGLDPDFASRVVDRYEARVVAEPGDAEARVRLAVGYYFRGDREAARRELERAAAIAPGDPWIWDYLGFLQMEIFKSDLASQSWKRALEADPNNALAHYLIGQLLYRQGHQHDAGAELERAAKLRAAGAPRP